MTPEEVDIVVEDADTSEAVHYSASKRSTVQEVTTTDIPKNLGVSKEGLLSSINHLGTLTMLYLG